MKDQTNKGELAVRSKGDLALRPVTPLLQKTEESPWWRNFRAKAEFARQLAGGNTLAFAARTRTSQLRA